MMRFLLALGMFALFFFLPVASWANPKEASVEELIRDLENQNLGPQRQVAAFHLGEREADASQAVPVLKRVFEEENWGLRGNIGEALAKIDTAESNAVISEQVLPVFMDALSHRDTKIRRTAVESLGRLGVKALPAFNALTNALINADDETRKLAAHALGTLETSKANEPLLRALRLDHHFEVRQLAARALTSQINNKRVTKQEVLDPLTKALQDESRFVRWDVVRALAALGEPGRVALQSAINDVDDSVRNLAQQSLEELGEAS